MFDSLTHTHVKSIIKSIAFLVIFCILWNGIFSVIWKDKSTVHFFYQEPKNSLDVVYIGSSNVLAHFNSTLAYDRYGFTTGLMTTSGQTFIAVKYFLIESQKYQKPKLYVIDIAKLADGFEGFLEAEIRNITDSLKFSKNRIDAINEILSYKDIDKKEYINYYFSFFMYHNRWKDISKRLFVGSESLYKGYNFNTNKNEIVPQNTFIWSDNMQELKPENKKVLMDLIEYIKANNLNVLFVIPPREFNQELNEYLNGATKLIMDNGFNVINFNKVEDLNIDYSTDFYNSRHLNVYGATKFTLYFAKYLKENYNLENHKNDSKYDTWDEEYERFKVDFKKLNKIDFDEVLKRYNI